MGSWVLFLERTSVLMSRLLYYVLLQRSLLCAVFLSHLCMNTQWKTLVTAHVQHPLHPNTPHLAQLKGERLKIANAEGSLGGQQG